MGQCRGAAGGSLKLAALSRLQLVSGVEKVSLPRPEQLLRDSDSSGITCSGSEGPAQKIVLTSSTHERCGNIHRPSTSGWL